VCMRGMWRKRQVACMGKRKRKLGALGDRSRRPFALPHVERKQREAERRALQGLSPEQVKRNVARVQEALRAAGLEGEG
jgi:hypothetical protein